jgi:hypothetical protein
MSLTALIVQIVGGAVAGNATGSLFKDAGLGALGNTIIGAIGGGLGGSMLSGILGAAAASSLDVGSIVSLLATGGASGGIAALVLGFLKSKLAG